MRRTKERWWVVSKGLMSEIIYTAGGTCMRRPAGVYTAPLPLKHATRYTHTLHPLPGPMRAYVCVCVCVRMCVCMGAKQHLDFPPPPPRYLIPNATSTTSGPFHQPTARPHLQIRRPSSPCPEAVRTIAARTLRRPRQARQRPRKQAPRADSVPP